MKVTFRWYGEDDPVTLQKIRQIPCVSDITTAVYKPVGMVWEKEEIESLKEKCNK
ncbi:MAG: mannonate dehydratase, partial [Clostridia bacterium]|nr:mannonate dehydratase [Clostridia bacterium]